MSINEAKTIGDIISGFNQSPWAMPIYFAILILCIGFFMWRYSQVLRKDVKADLQVFFETHKEEHKKIEFISEMRPRLEHIYDNFEIIKKAIDQEKLNNNISIYKFIGYELADLKDRFSKNYNNGSHKDKALQEISICQQKLLNMLNSAMIKALDRKSISTLIEFIFEKFNKLIESLSNLSNDPISKLSLINIYINNLQVLIDFFNLKEVDYINKSEEELKNILNKDFEKLGNNLVVKKKDLEEEF
jgi:hypothetical protein